MSSVILRRKSKLSGQLYYLTFESVDGYKAVLITDDKVIPLRLDSPQKYTFLNLSMVDLVGSHERRGYKKSFIVKSCKRKVKDKNAIEQTEFKIAS